MWYDVGARGVAAASGPEVRLRDGDTLLNNTYPIFHPQLKLRLRNMRIYLNYLRSETYTRIASDLRWMCDPTHYLTWMSVKTIRRNRYAYREYSLFGVGETWYTRWRNYSVIITVCHQIVPNSLSHVMLLFAYSVLALSSSDSSELRYQIQASLVSTLLCFGPVRG